MTQTEFYTLLGITKPYFYDILGGRANPPSHKLQFKALEILKANNSSRKIFFDLAAKARGDTPADISKWIYENPSAVENIRESMSIYTGGKINE